MLTSLLLSVGALVGFVALAATDPIEVEPAKVSVYAQHQGYSESLVSILLRERLRAIALEAATNRGDQLRVFDHEASAFDAILNRLELFGVIAALRDLMGLKIYTLNPALIHHPDPSQPWLTLDGQPLPWIPVGETMTLSVKGVTSTGQIFVVSATGNTSVKALIDEVAEKIIERIDPYVLTLYYYRLEQDSGVFSRTLPMVRHTTLVLPLELRKWPITLWGIIEAQSGRPERAIDLFRLALSHDPHHTDALVEWGRVLLALGKTEAALEKLGKAVQVAPSDPTQRAAIGWPTAHAILGDVLVSLGRDQEAWAVFVEGLQLAPQNPYLLTSLGGLYLRYGQLDAASELLEAALLIHPEKNTLRQLFVQLFTQEMQRLRPEDKP